MGHLHLHVGDIERGIAFYRDVLGFELQADLGTAAFLSAGGYHHHVGINVWNGRGVGPAPAHTAGLRHWTVQLPSVDEVRDARRGGGGGGRARRRRVPRPRPVADGRPLHVDLNTKGTTPCRSPSSAPATWPAGSRRAPSQAATPSRCSAPRTDKAQALAGELSGDVRAGAIGDPISGDVVVLAVWYQVLDDVLGRYGDQLDGKVVVDITNPVDPQTFQPLNVAAGSAAQEIAQKVPGAKVAKAFNTTFAGTLVEGQVGGQPLDVFVASDDEDAKAAAAPPRRGQRHALRSTPARSPSRASSKAPATCTWRSRATSAPPTGARSRSSRSRQEGVEDTRDPGRLVLR